jgi:DtxR family transcriptional regulator, Mn-dependent transcriptional regulator
MDLERNVEHLLVDLWGEAGEGRTVPESKRTPREPALLEEMVKRELLASAREPLRLTEHGTLLAKEIVRRYRLAERLLADVLDVRGSLITESACHFEHILHQGLDDRICTILGHPKSCPHGYPIPPGECCARAEATGVRVVSSLADLPPGTAGTIAYLHAAQSDRLKKLMAMGCLPGQKLSVIRNFPSYVFQMGFSQFAVDRDIANEIFVRISRS